MLFFSALTFVRRANTAFLAPAFSQRAQPAVSRWSRSLMTAALSGNDLEELEALVKAQGDKVRAAKESGGDVEGACGEGSSPVLGGARAGGKLDDAGSGGTCGGMRAGVMGACGPDISVGGVDGGMGTDIGGTTGGSDGRGDGEGGGVDGSAGDSGDGDSDGDGGGGDGNGGGGDGDGGGGDGDGGGGDKTHSTETPLFCQFCLRQASQGLGSLQPVSGQLHCLPPAKYPKQEEL